MHPHVRLPFIIAYPKKQHTLNGKIIRRAFRSAIYWQEVSHFNPFFYMIDGFAMASLAYPMSPLYSVSRL